MRWIKVGNIKCQTWDIKRFRSKNFDVKGSFHNFGTWDFGVFVETRGASLGRVARDSLDAFGNKRGGYGFRLKSPRDILPSTNDLFDGREEERRFPLELRRFHRLIFRVPFVFPTGRNGASLGGEKRKSFF